MIQLGCDGVFVGSGILNLKIQKRAKAIVEAVKTIIILKLAEISKG